jgi:hypothetical protein
MESSAPLALLAGAPTGGPGEPMGAVNEYVVQAGAAHGGAVDPGA